MNKNTAISVKNITKIYHLYDKPQDRLKEALHPFRNSYHHDFYALNDINFEIKKGETVGIIGKNGAGKSTLLKIITGVLTPTNGHVHVNGRIASLLELGAGFNPEYTGIENIYLQGTLMGYAHEEMENKIDDILAFADIGEFVHQQVKTYSSGMFARLAFAVAINVDPDILIVDEALSVGDARFQSKCINKMESIRGNGTTILFVSHAIEQVKRFCSSSIWIENGNIKMIGDSAIVGDRYTDALHLDEVTTENKHSIEYINHSSNTLAKIQSFEMNNTQLKTFDSVYVHINYEVFEEFVDSLLIGIAIYDNERKYIFGPNTYLDKFEIIHTKGKHTLKYNIPSISLLSGSYFFDIGIFTDKGIVNLDYHQNAISFTIENKYFTEGSVFIEHSWSQDV